MISGDILTRGINADEKLDLNAIRGEIQGALKNLTLAPGPHWLKVVYSQNAGKPGTVAVTLDNGDHAALTDAVKRLPWPRSEGFYMAKQFIVIR